MAQPNMRTLEGAQEYFAYRPATSDAALKYDRIRKAFLTLVANVWDDLPDSPDRTVALRALHTAQMQMITCVAVNDTPVDWDTPHIARVLPS